MQRSADEAPLLQYHSPAFHKKRFRLKRIFYHNTAKESAKLFRPLDLTESRSEDTLLNTAIIGSTGVKMAYPLLKPEQLNEQ